MKTLRIRNAEPQDLPGIQALYQELANASHNVPVPQQQALLFLKQLRRYPGSALLVGLIKDAPVSTCTLVVIPNLTRRGMPYALIENVATHRDHRNKGYATALLEAAACRAFEEGCYKVMLMTGSDAPATLRFYEKAGFEQSKTGFQKRHPDFPA